MRARLAAALRIGWAMTAGGTANGHPRGAYGLTVTGLPDACRVLQPSPAAWPSFHVDVVAGSSTSVVTRWGPDDADIALWGGGVSRMRREPLTAVITLPAPPGDEAVVHPFLAGSSAVANWWLGRDSFHGGAFVADGGA